MSNDKELPDEDRFFHYLKACRLWNIKQDTEDPIEQAKFDGFIIRLHTGTKTLGMIEPDDVLVMTNWMRYYIYIRLTLKATQDDILGNAS